MSPEPAPLPTRNPTRSGRTPKPPDRYDESVHSSLLAYSATFEPTPTDTAVSLIQPDTSPSDPHPLALFMSSLCALTATDPDTMTLKEAMAQPDREDFLRAMHKELSDHINHRHWRVVPKKSVPPHKRCIPMVWSMKRKLNPLGEITKWKARLCAGGHRSVEFVDYWDTYSPVVS